MTRDPHLVLASASPRRRELLARLDLDFEVRPTGTDETPHPGEAPEAHVLRLAAAKANAAARPGEMVLGADTIVVVDGEILGKPGDDEEARAMLRRLSGRAHEVWTGVALAVRAENAEPELHSRSCRTLVRFRALTDADIDAYRELVLRDDGGAAYLRIMANLRRGHVDHRAVVDSRTTPYPVRVVWGAKDPILPLRRYGWRARDAARVPAVSALPAKHYLQEEQPAAISELVSDLAVRARGGRDRRH